MQWKNELTERASAPENKPVEGSAEKVQVLASFCNKPSVALQTSRVVIRGNGKRRTARAIIDSGSQRSYLLLDTAKEMAYQPEGFVSSYNILVLVAKTQMCASMMFLPCTYQSLMIPTTATSKC
ncbi:hypothetical protein JTE90_028917 [Oedothorax gibbosus]|uniref:Peptidase aspartic putative domain-containing protein n=1 Tax=Oedothorax gibbosus TaxID=931172 RepID=A0AAV6TZ29_9ARAC|nr:hypothetical protein JTE90_028917 [Oedothorax gibbosus]